MGKHSEIVRVLTIEQATALTEQTRAAGDRYHELLIRCYQEKAWEALGYGSWDAYAVVEFSASRSSAYRMLDQARVVLELDSHSVPRARDTVTMRQAGVLARDAPAAAAEVAADIADGSTPKEAVRKAVGRRAKPIEAKAVAVAPKHLAGTEPAPIPEGIPIISPVGTRPEYPGAPGTAGEARALLAMVIRIGEKTWVKLAPTPESLREAAKILTAAADRLDPPKSRTNRQDVQPIFKRGQEAG